MSASCVNIRFLQIIDVDPGPVLHPIVAGLEWSAAAAAAAAADA